VVGYQRINPYRNDPVALQDGRRLSIGTTAPVAMAVALVEEWDRASATIFGYTATGMSRSSIPSHMAAHMGCPPEGRDSPKTRSGS
jgi:hypothetical protein